MCAQSCKDVQNARTRFLSSLLLLLTFQSCFLLLPFFHINPVILFISLTPPPLSSLFTVNPFLSPLLPPPPPPMIPRPSFHHLFTLGERAPNLAMVIFLFLAEQKRGKKRFAPDQSNFTKFCGFAWDSHSISVFGVTSWWCGMGRLTVLFLFGYGRSIEYSHVVMTIANIWPERWMPGICFFFWVILWLSSAMQKQRFCVSYLFPIIRGLRQSLDTHQRKTK